MKMGHSVKTEQNKQTKREHRIRKKIKGFIKRLEDKEITQKARKKHRNGKQRKRG